MANTMAVSQLDLDDVQKRKAKIIACDSHASSAAKKKCLEDAATVKTDYRVLINPIIYLIAGCLILYAIYRMIK